MFRLKRLNKVRIAPLEVLSRPPESSQPDNSKPYTAALNDCNQPTTAPQFHLDTSSLLLDVHLLPPEFSKEFKQLYKIPEFGSKFSATVVHLSFKIESVVDEMIAGLYPNMVHFMPNVAHEPPLSAPLPSSSTRQSPFSPRPDTAPSPSSSTRDQTTSRPLIPKLSEVNCCLWIIQESLGMPKNSSAVIFQHHGFHKLSLQRLKSKLKSLKPTFKDYLRKFETLQDIVSSIAGTMKADYKRCKDAAKEHHRKFLVNCEPDAISCAVERKWKAKDGAGASIEEERKIKFQCTQLGYTILGTGDLGSDLAPSNPHFWASGGALIRPLPTKLKSEILYSIIRELEFRIERTVSGTPTILSKLLKSNPDGIRQQIDQLLRLAQFHGLKLTTNAAVSILFSFKRVKSKMELFRRLLVKFEGSTSLARKRIGELLKCFGSGNGVRVGSAQAGLSEQMLLYSRNKLIRLYDRLEITLYTEWPECFRDYILEKKPKDVKVNCGQGDQFGSLLRQDLDLDEEFSESD